MSPHALAYVMTLAHSETRLLVGEPDGEEDELAFQATVANAAEAHEQRLVGEMNRAEVDAMWASLSEGERRAKTKWFD